MNDTASLLHLRPHHLLCLQTFEGHGYSDEFTAHMTLVKRQLAEDPNTPIVLVTGADELCAHCPNCADGQCTSGKPALFDLLVTEKLNHLQPPLNSLPFHNGIPESLFITENILSECCPGCEWKELCIKICRISDH